MKINEMTSEVEAAIEEKRALLNPKSVLERARQKANVPAETRAIDAGSVKPDKKNSIIAKEKKNMFEINSHEYRSLWLKNLQGRLTEEERAGFTQTSTYATNAIPTEVADKFFEKMKKLAPMLSEITLLRVAGNIQFVVEGTRNTATQHTENAQISVSEDTTVKVTLGAFEFFKILAISESARQMSIDAFENWLIEMLAGDIARAIDDYIINDATNGIVAITPWSTGTNQILNTAGPTYGNICDLIGLLPAAYDAEAKFLVHKKFNK